MGGRSVAGRYPNESGKAGDMESLPTPGWVAATPPTMCVGDGCLPRLGYGIMRGDGKLAYICWVVVRGGTK